MLCIRGALSGECECACGSPARCAGKCCAGASPPPGCGAPPLAASPFWPAGSAAAAAAAAGATNGIVGPPLSEGCRHSRRIGLPNGPMQSPDVNLSQMLDELHGVKGSLLQSSSQPKDCTQECQRTATRACLGCGLCGCSGAGRGVSQRRPRQLPRRRWLRRVAEVAVLQRVCCRQPSRRVERQQPAQQVQCVLRRLHNPVSIMK